MTSTPMQPQLLTAKGRRTREAILTAAAALIHEFGVAATTIDDVKAAAGVSSSQLYHYFAHKDDLVRAVVDRQASLTVELQREVDLRTPDGVHAWFDAVITRATEENGRGGCPLGSLGGQLGESDAWARDRMSAGFTAWEEAIRAGLTHLQSGGHLRAGTEVAPLATTVLATLQGGLLLAQLHRDVAPLRAALTTLLKLAVT